MRPFPVCEVTAMKAKEILDSLLYYPAVFIMKANMKLGMWLNAVDTKMQKQKCVRCTHYSCPMRFK